MNSYLGWWGNFGGLPQKGIASYTLAGNQQKPTAGIVHAAIFNSWRRFKGNVLYVVPPFVAYYFIMDWAEKRCVIHNPPDELQHAAGVLGMEVLIGGLQEPLPQQQGGPQALRRVGGVSGEKRCFLGCELFDPASSCRMCGGFASV